MVHLFCATVEYVLAVAHSLIKSRYYFNNETLSSQDHCHFSSCQGGAPAQTSSAPPPPRSGLTTVPRPHRASRHSPLRQSASLTRRTSWFGPASSFLPSHCACCCCCCLVSTYADERRRHIPPSLLFEGRFQFAFTFLLAGTIGFRAVPVNSPPSPARVEQQQLGNIWPPQSARLPVPPPARLGSLLWKLVESQSSFVSEGKKKKDWTEEAGKTLERVVCKCCF